MERAPDEWLVASSDYWLAHGIGSAYELDIYLEALGEYSEWHYIRNANYNEKCSPIAHGYAAKIDELNTVSGCRSACPGDCANLMHEAQGKRRGLGAARRLRA